MGNAIRGALAVDVSRTRSQFPKQSPKNAWLGGDAGPKHATLEDAPRSASDHHSELMHIAGATALPEGLGKRNERVASLFQKFHRYVRVVLQKRRAVPAADVEDLTQEVFLRLLRYGDKTVIEHPASYLIRVAGNVAHEWNGRARQRLPHDDVSMFAELLCEAHDEPESVALRAEKIRRVSAAIRQLTPRRREVLLMHIHDGLTSKQIAQSRGLTHRVVVRDLYRSYSALRERLETEEI